VLRDDERLEVRFNSEWLDMPMEELFRLVRTSTVAQLLERDDFAKRFAAHRADLAARAALSGAAGLRLGRVRADVELGGTDQTFNLLMGRASSAPTASPSRSC
jgi:tyrosyl-tRNA synthetase